MKKLRGVHTPHHKSTAGMAAETMPIPAEVRIPMAMSIGAPATPIVSVGDEVKVGQLIAEPSGFVSVPIHSSVSGTVKSINDVDEITGQGAVSITITADGEQSISEDLAPPEVSDLQSFLDAVRNSGVVGLGGAGFPTAVKLTLNEQAKLEYILINGAECEPYITSDTRTMIDDADLMLDGILLLKRFFGVKIIIGVENNNPEAIKSMQQLAAGEDGVEVNILPALYPQGGEKVLIFNITGRIVPEGGLPIDVGCVVLNCTTVAAMARYFNTGMPLVSKCITVDGSAVGNPKNLIVPVGTYVREILEYCGTSEDTVKKVLLGGPMMGQSIPSTDMPILKATNAVLAFNEKDAQTPVPSACIRCGRCVSHCPLQLTTLEIERAFELNKPELLEHYKVNLCMECGCCAFNCPSRRPLIQSIKMAKIMLRDYQTAQRLEAERKAAKEAEKNE
ncbi:MAG: electron transport complex subunit RsxC [Oscillospiraceae bacterium]|nr:electron transport complex subunit RsxC [Oscillospiraceae bacterium]